MSMPANLGVGAARQRAAMPLADWLAVAVAVSLPWSTSATAILVAAWFVAVLPGVGLAAVRRELMTAAGGLPVVLIMLAGVGVLWAQVSWSERWEGFVSFHRLLAIPLLLAQFRRSEHGTRVIGGLFFSICAMLLLSWTLLMFPSPAWHVRWSGVPVKDYIVQSENFMMCAFAVLAMAFDEGSAGRWRTALGLLTLVVLFLTNITFEVTARTTLLIAPVLAVLLGWRQFRWKGVIGAVVVLGIIGGVLALESPYLRARFNASVAELQNRQSNVDPGSLDLHLQFIKEALSFVRTAPLLGHGTGSIAAQYRQEAAKRSGAAGVASVNPHNQILAVAIQLGLVGAVLLLAMWYAHFMLFRGAGLVAWIGIVLVAENVVTCLFNSHLFDFTQAWIYVFGVGTAGGMMLRARDGEAEGAAALSK